MSNKNHVFQVWESDNRDFIRDNNRLKLVATFDTRDEAQTFAAELSRDKNKDCYGDLWEADDYTYIIKRVHR